MGKGEHARARCPAVDGPHAVLPAILGFPMHDYHNTQWRHITRPVCSAVAAGEFPRFSDRCHSSRRIVVVAQIYAGHTFRRSVTDVLKTQVAEAEPFTSDMLENAGATVEIDVRCAFIRRSCWVCSF